MDAVALTDLLHKSPLSLWVRLREVLVQKGLDLEATALAWSSEEGPEVEFGVIATTERRVFQYLLVTDELAEWNDVSASWETTPYADAVRAAFPFLRQLVAQGNGADLGQALVAVGLTFAEYAVLWHVSDTVVVDRETLASWVCDHVPNNVPDEVSLDACRSAIDSLVRKRLLVELTESDIEEDLARWRAEPLPVSWGVDRDRRPGDVDLTEHGYRVLEALTRSLSSHAARPAQGYNDETVGRIRVFGETESACHEAVKHVVARIDKPPWGWPRGGIHVDRCRAIGPWWVSRFQRVATGFEIVVVRMAAFS